MISNSKRSSWTTRWFRDRPPRSTPHPKEVVLYNSCCPRAHCSRNRHALQRPPSPSYPTPNNGGKGKGKCKGKEKSKNNCSENNSRGNNTIVWPSFFNLWTGTILMWSGMRPHQQPTHPPQHALLVAPPLQQQAATPTWSS
jgi:hypothetical protein